MGVCMGAKRPTRGSGEQGNGGGTQAPSPSAEPGASEAFRLTFEYDGKEKLTLKSIRRLAMRVPPGQSQDEMLADQIGRFVELRGDKGYALYRRQITDLIPQTVEYPTGDPERPFGRVPNRVKGIVSVLVPAIKGARSVGLVETMGPSDERVARGRARRRDMIAVDLPRDEEMR